MTFTPSQKNKLVKISACFRRIEKIALEGNLDLDYFTRSYKTTLPVIDYNQEIADQLNRAGYRKTIFEENEIKQATKKTGY